jgi:AraC-like DNA-binding protein
MAFIVDTKEIAQRDRAEWVSETLSRIVPVELGWPAHQQGVSAYGSINPLGQLVVVLGRTSALKMERTPSLARDAMEPCVFACVQLTGSRTIVQNGQEAVLHPGDLTIFDSTSPYTLLSDSGVQGALVRIPLAALAMPHDVVRKVCAANVSPGHPLTRLTSDYICRLATDPDLAAAPNAELIAAPTMELVRAVIATHLETEALAAEPLAATLQLRLMDYAHRHLQDPNLSAEQIAAAHFISVRYLYKILAAGGISLGDWIRTHRLQACREELARTATNTTIEAVARRHGFSNMSSFSRAFRTEYGISPREWRDRNAMS